MKDRAIHHRRVVGASSRKTSDTNAVYTKEERYIKNLLRQQNENTWKDVTPLSDQDAIRHDIARATFRSKLDMTEAYEQTHIRPEDVGKMTFSTIFGTFQSQVQMGDCNAPSTFQQLMTAIF